MATFNPFAMMYPHFNKCVKENTDLADWLKDRLPEGWSIVFVNKDFPKFLLHATKTDNREEINLSIICPLDRYWGKVIYETALSDGEDIMYKEEWGYDCDLPNFFTKEEVLEEINRLHTNPTA